MIPLVGQHARAQLQAKDRARVAEEVFEQGQEDAHPLLVGTMIELPRAALTAGEIAARRPSSSPSAPTT